VSPFNIRAALSALFALLLSGCVDSSNQIMSDSQAMLGQHPRLQFYGMRDGTAREPEQATFKWNGSLYVRIGGGMRDVGGFSIHPFENGNYIVQEVPAKRTHMFEYALMRKLLDGVYQVIVIDEDDADEATRTAQCGKGTKTDPASCRIQTRDQLFAFARATAAKHRDTGGLVIRLPDNPEKPARARRRR
jgi:hypothetical protein